MNVIYARILWVRSNLINKYCRFFLILVSSKMSNQSHGVQQLLMAEKRAEDKVSGARRRKAQRLKQAKIEAQEEVTRYKQERELQLKEFEKVHLSSCDDIAKKIRLETEQKIEEMQGTIFHKLDAVAQSVLEILYDIRPKTNVNFVRE